MTAEKAAPVAPEIAAELVHLLFVLCKAAKVYDRANEAYLRHSQDARLALSKALQDEGGVLLETRGDRLFFNKRRIKFHVESSAGGRFLIDELARRGAGGLDVSRDFDPTRLDAFVAVFNAVEPRRGEGLSVLRERLRAAGVAGVEVRPPAAGAGGGGGEPEGGALAAKRTFFRAVRLVSELMTRARAGETVGLAQAKRVVHELVDRVIEDEQTFFELATIRSFDEYTYAHSVNVCVYGIAIGTRLGLGRERLSELGFGCLFHDLGKVCLPMELINKPDEFDEAEWRQMRRHPALGVKALLAMRRPDPALARAAAVAFEHHLGADGAGYPPLARPRKPGLFSRVCAVADSFDAMTSGRVYVKKPMSPAEALRRMILRSGTAYDPFLLRLFINAVGVFPIGTPLLLDTGQEGVVCRNNPGDLLRPKVKVLGGGPKGAPGGSVVDLSKGGVTMAPLTWRGS